jgi:hypothetical protein
MVMTVDVVLGEDHDMFVKLLCGKYGRRISLIGG